MFLGTLLLIFYVSSAYEEDAEIRFDIIVATRYNAQDFFEYSLFSSMFFDSSGRMKKIDHLIAGYLRIHVFYENQMGISKVYNEGISAILQEQGEIDNGSIIVFLHDDVFIFEHNWMQILIDGLNMFDMVGIVGSTERWSNQPNWCCLFEDDTLAHPHARYSFKRIPKEYQSGGNYIGSNNIADLQFDYFGPYHRAIRHVDGFFLAVHTQIIRNHSIRFDESFDFHMYDLDMSRLFEEKELSIGTVPLSALHTSSSKIGTAEWWVNYMKYISKWKD